MKISRQELFERFVNEDIDLADALKLMRKSIGMNQKEYAKFTGVALEVLRSIEQKKGNPRMDSVSKLLKPFALRMVVKRKGKK